MNSPQNEAHSGVIILYFAYFIISILASVKITKYILSPKLSAYKLFIGWLSFCFIGIALAIPVHLVIESHKNTKDFGIGLALNNISQYTHAIGYFSMVTFWITAYVISKKEHPVIERVLRWIFLIGLVFLVVIFGALGFGYFKSTPSQPQAPAQAPVQNVAPQPASTPPVVSGGTSEAEEMRMAREHFAKIYSAHPDADALMQSSVFNVWMSQSIERRRVVQQGTADEVIDLFNTYKAQR